MYCICCLVSHLLVCVLVSVYVCMDVGEGLCGSYAMPNPFVLTNKICLNQTIKMNYTEIL